MRLLKELCDASGDKSQKFAIITSHLGPHHKHNYRTHNREDKVNFYRTIDLGKDKTIALTCHHDIVDPKSDNCLDNNASLYNILTLLQEIDYDKLKYNLIIGIVDEEESGGGGIRQFVDMHLFDMHYDFELTAAGTKVVYTPYGDVGEEYLHGMVLKQQPLNNAAMAHYHCSRNDRSYSGACLTMLYPEDLMSRYPTNWRLIHSIDDRFEIANENEMLAFRQTLLRLFSHP